MDDKLEKILRFFLKKQGAVYCESCEEVVEDLEHFLHHHTLSKNSKNNL